MARGGTVAEIAGVRITHPDRVMYRDPGVTKLDVARYYEAIAAWVLPHVEGRPLTLVRCPTGLTGECFFHEAFERLGPAALRRVRIPEKTKIGEYLVADSLAGVVSLVQMDVLEIHTWNSRIDHLERPDRLVFDIDPGPDVQWPRVVAAARLVRETLAGFTLESFLKTTGGRGMHVVVPLVSRADWSECLAFARGVADRIATHDPGRYTTRFAKTGREDKIDYLRNNRTERGGDSRVSPPAAQAAGVTDRALR